MGTRKQIIVEREALIRAMLLELENLSPQRLSECAKVVLGEQLNPLASHRGPLFTAMAKSVHNRHLLNECQDFDADERVIEIIRRVRAANRPDKVFAASTIALVSAGIHLTRSELEAALQMAQREGG